MVEKFKNVLLTLLEEKKNIALFAILKMDDITDRWSVIYSSPDVNSDTDRRKEFVHLVDLILNELDENERGQIARVGVFPTDNHLVANLLKYSKGYEIKSSTPVNGNMVHEGFILESNSAKVDKTT